MTKAWSMLGLAAAVSASAIPNFWGSSNVECVFVDTVVQIFREQCIATAFCSEYLHLSTSTYTKTQTVTPCPTTVSTTVLSTSTLTVSTTSVTSTVTTVYPVVAVPTTLTCSVPSSNPSPVAKAKRDFQYFLPKPGCLGRYNPPSEISAACSCLHIPTPTRCTVTTVTLPTSTVTKIFPSTADVTVTVTVTSTSWTSTYSATQYYTQTSTILPAPTASLTESDGTSFGVYNGLDFSGLDIVNFFCYAGGPQAPSPFTGTCSSFSDCVGECAYYNDNNLGAASGTKCGAVVYHSAPDGSSASCYLKTGLLGCGSSNANVTTGVILPLVASDFQ